MLLLAWQRPGCTWTVRRFKVPSSGFRLAAGADPLCSAAGLGHLQRKPLAQSCGCKAWQAAHELQRSSAGNHAVLLLMACRADRATSRVCGTLRPETCSIARCGAAPMVRLTLMLPMRDNADEGLVVGLLAEHSSSLAPSRLSPPIHRMFDIRHILASSARGTTPTAHMWQSTYAGLRNTFSGVFRESPPPHQAEEYPTLRSSAPTCFAPARATHPTEVC